MLRNRESAYERVLDDDSVEQHLADVADEPLSERELSNRQFAFPKRPFPTREILLGVGLFLGGSFVLVLGLLNLLGLWQNEVEGSSLAFVFLGLMALIPGGYATWIAFNSWRGVRGYSFDQMPQIHRGS